MRPVHAVTVQGNLKFHRQDYKGTYFGYNPQTGQYGYIAENGAQGSSVPLEMGVWDPNLFPSVLTRVRNLPLDTELLESNPSADCLITHKTPIHPSLTFVSVSFSYILFH